MFRVNFLSLKALVFVAGRETCEAALGATHELIVTKAAVFATHELVVVAGGETLKAEVGE